VTQAELSYFVADQAQRMGISPEFFARQLTESNQIGVAITEVLRGKAATLTAERVTVTDDKGETIDVKAQIEALNSDVDAMLAAQAAAEGAVAPDIEVDDLAIDVAGALEDEDGLEDEDAAETEVVLEAVAEAEAEAEVVDEAEAIVEDAEDDEK
jgi:trigger factor